MRKNYLFMALAGMLLASCSNEMEEVFDTSQGNEISFRPFVEAMTRAADITAANLTSFNVTAFPTGTATTAYMDNVTYTNNSGTYTSDTKYFWPASNLDFYAYAPTDGAPATLATTNTSGNQITRTAYNVFTITPSSTLTEQADLVFANTNDKGKDDSSAGAIALNFRHAGAKIVLKVKNSQPNLKLEVSGFKIVNVDGEATFTYNKVADGSTEGSGMLKVADWTNNADAQNSSYSTGSFTAANAIPASQNAAMFLNHAENSPSTTYIDEDLSMILIPQTTSAATAYSAAASKAPVTTGSYIAVKMVIKNNSDGTVIADATGSDTYSSQTYDKWAMWPVAFNWEPGKKYTYTIDLGDGGYWEINNDADTDLDPILENAEIKFVSVTVDGWFDKAVNIPPPTSLAGLKELINTGEDCSDYIGYYVDASGNISSTDNTAIGVIAHISTSAVDNSFADSRIIVISKNTDFSSKIKWANGTPYSTLNTGISNIKATDAYNGYANTEALYAITENPTNYYPAAQYAWEFQGKSSSGLTAVTGSSGWFLPSMAQLAAITSTFSSYFDDRTKQYWTSTEYDDYASYAYFWHMDRFKIEYIEKTREYLVVPIFVY